MEPRGRSSSSRTLDERYGRRPARRERRLVLLAAALLAAAAVAWGLWVATGVASTPLHWQDVGYDVRGDAATDVSFDLSFDPDLPADAVAVCTVRALNTAGADVGLRDVTIAREGDRPVRTVVSIPTSERAVTGVVKDCLLR